MMTGWGQFGAVEMGGMFTMVKIREDLAKNDYKDPGPYQYPEGTVAYELNTEAPAIERKNESGSVTSGIEFAVRRRQDHRSVHSH